MSENKTTMIVLGCIGVLCLCGAAAGVLSAGFYYYSGDGDVGIPSIQATIPPEDIPTRLPAMTPTGSAQSESVPEEIPERDTDSESELGELVSVSVLPFSYDDNEDEIDEGVAIDLVFYDAYEEVISFTNTPIEITMEFYAFTDFLGSSDIANGDLIYTETVTRDHSSTLEEMFTNYIRIPYTEMQVNPNQYVRFGAVHVIVDTPNGTFEDVSTLVSLYPEEE